MKLPYLSSLALVVLLSACREPNQPAPPAAPSAAATQSEAAKKPTPAVAAASAYPDGTSFGVGELCNIEYLGENAFAAAAVPLQGTEVLRGWLADAGGATPQSIELRFVDTNNAPVAHVPIVLGEPRDDVVAAFPGKSLPADTGFSLRLAAAQLPAGTWRIYLTYTAANGRAIACDNGRTIVVSPSG
jgi:hypothetical protein